MREDWKENLGLICSGAYRLFQDQLEMHADVDLWYAPSECHGDVARSCERDREVYWDSVKEQWGCTMEQVRDEFKQRVVNSYHTYLLATMCFM